MTVGLYHSSIQDSILSQRGTIINFIIVTSQHYVLTEETCILRCRPIPVYFPLLYLTNRFIRVQEPSQINLNQSSCSTASPLPWTDDPLPFRINSVEEDVVW